MSDQKTIADSKRAFHKAFPHVIPALYRRLVDELLVELHLLSHQKNFHTEGIFAVGLTTIFEVFTEGYRPQKHQGPLFDAICGSCGFDAKNLVTKATRMTELIEKHSLDELKEWITENGVQAEEPLNQTIKKLKKGEFHYSRLLAIGISKLIEQVNKNNKTNEMELKTTTIEVAQQLGLPHERVEKDLALYFANIEKLQQAIELIRETLESERNKK